jgi:hypothetical protein
MKDDDRKLLTEFLGECWHDYEISKSEKSRCSCGLTGYAVREICAKTNRTFTTADDMMAVKRKLV